MKISVWLVVQVPVICIILVLLGSTLCLDIPQAPAPVNQAIPSDTKTEPNSMAKAVSTAIDFVIKMVPVPGAPGQNSTNTTTAAPTPRRRRNVNPNDFNTPLRWKAPSRDLNKSIIPTRKHAHLVYLISIYIESADDNKTTGRNFMQIRQTKQKRLKLKFLTTKINSDQK